MTNAAPRLKSCPCPARVFLGRPVVRLTVLAIALLAGSPGMAQTMIQGTVINETTGQPQPRVILTLVSFAGGMTPIEETRSGPDGSFAFEKPLPAVSTQQPMRGMLRAEFQGISYSEMIRGDSGNNIRIGVYSVSESNIPPPHARVVILEPTGSELVVSESFLYNNDTNPPRSYRDPVNGTLRFYLPPEAKGVVQVTYAGEARMPLNSSATPTDEPNVYKADVPLRPGDNQIDLAYVIPHQEGGVFESRVLYPGVKTRIAVPAGVTAESESLSSMGTEPRTQASLFETSNDEPFQLTISGQGRLSAAGDEPAPSEGGGGVRIAPAPVHEEVVWVVALTCGILGLGFFRLFTAKTPAVGAMAAEGQGANGSRPRGDPTAKPGQRKR